MKHDKDKPAVAPDANEVRTNDVALVKEVREVIKKYGYQAADGGIHMKSPVCQENTEKTMERFSWNLEIYQLRDDPFAGA
jgi:hypothetical protein